MLRTILAAAAVVLVFGATLVIGGEKLGAWDEPTPTAVPEDAVGFKARRPAASREAPKRPKRKRSPTARASRAPGWVAELDALCRRAEASTAGLQEPQTLPELRTYVQRVAALSRRWNRQASAGPLARAARRHPDTVQRLRGLFAEERLLIQDAMAATEGGDLAAFGELGPVMISNGVEQSQLLVSLGAQDCALPPELG